MINTQLLQAYFLQFRDVPLEWEDANDFLNWYLKQNTNLLNSKAIGTYSSQSIPAGKRLYITSKEYEAFRLTIDFGALPNAGVKTVAHGITPYLPGFRLLNMFLSATNTTTGEAFSLQYYSIAASDITLLIDPTNVTVTTASNYSPYNVSYVIIEFLTGVP